MTTINALALDHINRVITAGSWQDWLRLARECRGEYVRQRVLRATEKQGDCAARHERWHRFAQTDQLGYYNQQAIRLLIARLTEKFTIHQIILFGSRARGDYREYSDLDLAVIISDDIPSFTWNDEIGNIVNDTWNELDCLCALLSLHLINFDHWQGRTEFTNPSFLNNIRREGIVLFSAPESLP